jgi:hypothetical protein
MLLDHAGCAQAPRSSPKVSELRGSSVVLGLSSMLVLDRFSGGAAEKEKDEGANLLTVIQKFFSSFNILYDTKLQRFLESSPGPSPPYLCRISDVIEAVWGSSSRRVSVEEVIEAFRSGRAGGSNAPPITVEEAPDKDGKVQAFLRIAVPVPSAREWVGDGDPIFNVMYVGGGRILCAPPTAHR